MDIQEKAERWAAEKEPPEVLCRPGIQQPEEEEEERRGPHRHGKDLNWDWKPMERDDSGIQQRQEHQGHWPFRMGRSSKEACSPHSPVQTGPVTHQEKQQGNPVASPCADGGTAGRGETARKPPPPPTPDPACTQLGTEQSEMIIPEVTEGGGTWYSCSLIDFAGRASGLGYYLEGKQI